MFRHLHRLPRPPLALLLMMTPLHTIVQIIRRGQQARRRMGRGRIVDGYAARCQRARVMLRDADLVKHRVGALAFEGPTGALEPPKPDVLARLLIVSLAPSHGVVFLNACDTYIQAHWLQQHGASHVIYAGSRISDAAASEFSRGFYEALAFGCATPEAYEQGKLAVELRYDTVQHGCPSLLQQPGVGEAGGGSSRARAPALLACLHRWQAG